MTKNPPHYAAIKAEADRVRWPERFRSDVTIHDRAALAKRDPSAPFGWVLSCLGTHLIFPSTGLVDKKHRPEEMPQIVCDAFGEDDCRFYWWNGRSLCDVKLPEVLADRLRDEGDRLREAARVAS
jgi:hypothetical protein